MADAQQRDRETTQARLIAAVEGLILEQGFGAVGVNALARRAGVDKVLIYRYFGGLPGLLTAYAEKGDFWWRVADILAEPMPAGGDPEGLPKALWLALERHTAFLRSHPVTLEVIAWELADRNELTQALEAVRERRSVALMRGLAGRFGLDEALFLHRFAPMLALLGGAANYLAARGRRLRTFNGIDLQSEQGWATLSRCAGTMIAAACAGGVPASPVNPSPRKG